jgi:DNA-binding MurR/RpiR family transcriptional regulator
MKDRIDLIRQINLSYESLSKGHRKIADYIINNSERVAFMTAADLGKKVGTSESTVVRFAKALNFSGYPKLQKALQQLIRNKLTTVQRMKMTDHENQSEILKKVLDSDIQNIRNSLTELNPEVFQQVVQEIQNAKHIFIMGMRSSKLLAEYFVFYLKLIRPGVYIVDSEYNEPIESLLHIAKDDLVITISYPRYSYKTIETLEFIRKKGIKIVGITDSMESPIYSVSHYPLIAQGNMFSIVDSLVAPMSVINALIVAIGNERREALTERFTELEEIWDSIHTYSQGNK